MIAGHPPQETPWKYSPWTMCCSSNPHSQEIVHFDPLYSYRHTLREEGQQSVLES